MIHTQSFIFNIAKGAMFLGCLGVYEQTYGTSENTFLSVEIWNNPNKEIINSLIDKDLKTFEELFGKFKKIATNEKNTAYSVVEQAQLNWMATDLERQMAEVGSRLSFYDFILSSRLMTPQEQTLVESILHEKESDLKLAQGRIIDFDAFLSARKVSKENQQWLHQLRQANPDEFSKMVASKLPLVLAAKSTPEFGCFILKDLTRYSHNPRIRECVAFLFAAALGEKTSHQKAFDHFFQLVQDYMRNTAQQEQPDEEQFPVSVDPRDEHKTVVIQEGKSAHNANGAIISINSHDNTNYYVTINPQTNAVICLRNDFPFVLHEILHTIVSEIGDGKYTFLDKTMFHISRLLQKSENRQPGDTAEMWGEGREIFAMNSIGVFSFDDDDFVFPAWNFLSENVLRATCGLPMRLIHAGFDDESFNPDEGPKNCYRRIKGEWPHFHKKMLRLNGLDEEQIQAALNRVPQEKPKAVLSDYPVEEEADCNIF